MQRRTFYQSLSTLVEATQDSERGALASETLAYCLKEMRVLRDMAEHRQHTAHRQWRETDHWPDDPGIIIIE
jgi:hypothetical protein